MTLIQRFINWLDAHPRRALAFIVLLAAMIGLGRIWSKPLSMDAGQTDNFWPIANHLLDGQGYTLCYPLYFPFCPGGEATPTAMREPIPVLLFAAAAAVSGRSLLVAMHVQVLMCVLVVLLTYRFTRTWAGTRAALIAALAWAIYLPAIEIQNQLSGDLVGTCLILCSACALQRAGRDGGVRWWIITGALLGLAALSRSAMLLMLLPWCAVAYHAKPGIRLAVRPMASMGVAMLLVLSPWAIRNHTVFGKWWTGTSMNGYNFWRMNQQSSMDVLPHYVASYEADSLSHELLAKRTDLKGTENEAEMDRVYMEEGMRSVKADPVGYVRLCSYRLLQLLTNFGVKSQYGLSAGLFDHAALGQQCVYLALAFLGIWRFRRDHWPWILGIVLQVAAYSAIVAQSRYLIPMMPFLISFAAVALAGMLWRKRTA